MQEKIYLTDQKRYLELSNGLERAEIHFMYTSGVSVEEARCIRLGLEKIMGELRTSIRLVNSGNADRYQEKALTSRQSGFGRQVDVVPVHLALTDDPSHLQNPHMSFVVLDKDLWTGDQLEEYIYGAGVFPHAIMSVARIRQIPHSGLKNAVMMYIAAHEFCHVLGLVDRNWNIGSTKHCLEKSDPCLMIESGEKLSENAIMLVQQDNWLCHDCTVENNVRKTTLESQGYVW